MFVGLFTVCLLISKLVRCGYVSETNEENGQCTFTFINADYEEFLQHVPEFGECTRRFEKANLSIKLMNCNLPAFPNGSFMDLPHLQSFNLNVSSGSDIKILSPLIPGYSVFDNLKFETSVLSVTNSPSLNGWKWEALSNLQPMKTFEFIAKNSKITRLGPSFGKIANGKLVAIRITNCKLRWLSENVFENFTNLLSLELPRNLIEKFERSYLPKDASKLEIIDLRKNRLQFISPELFGNLNLKKLYLQHNSIKILDQDIKSILIVRLQRYIVGVLWPCDCSQLQQLSTIIYRLSEEECYTTENNLQTIKEFITTSCHDLYSKLKK